MNFQNKPQLYLAIESSEAFYRSLAPRQYLLDVVVNEVLPCIQLTPLAIQGSWTASISGKASFPNRVIPQATCFFQNGPRQISFYLPLPAAHVKEEVALLFAHDLMKETKHHISIDAWNEYEINGDIDFQLASKYL